MIHISRDIIQYIGDYLDFESQINLQKTIKFSLTNMYITNKLSIKITDDILKKNIYLKKLNLYYNTQVTDIRFLKNLTTLNIGGKWKINIDRINCSKIKTLNITNNINITDLGRFEVLENLVMDGICGVEIEEISKLKNLKYISVVDNPIKKKLIEIENKNINIQYFYIF